VLENSFQSPLFTHSFVDRFVTDLGLTVPPREKKKQAPRATVDDGYLLHLGLPT